MKIDDTTFTRVSPSGVLEVLDMVSGEVISTSEPLTVATRYEYSPTYGKAVCELVRGGMLMSECATRPGVPPLQVLYSWRDRYPDFAEGLERARADRAERYHDQIVQAVGAIEDRETAVVETARINALKWLAEKGNPARYGQKVAVDQKIEGQVGFYVLDTGISREKKELPSSGEKAIIEIECKNINTDEGVRDETI